MRREEGKFSLDLVCDIQHSPHPVTLPLHGWTQVYEQCVQQQAHTHTHTHTHTHSGALYNILDGVTGSRGECGLPWPALWTDSSGHLLPTHSHSHQPHQRLSCGGVEAGRQREGERCGCYTRREKPRHSSYGTHSLKYSGFQVATRRMPLHSMCVCVHEIYPVRLERQLD